MNAAKQFRALFSYDDEMRLKSTVMPDDGPTVRMIKEIVGARVLAAPPKGADCDA